MFDLLGSGVLSLIAFVAVISFVVVIHELGHYAAGRFFGVHAETFSLGFGPTLANWSDRRGTIWRIAALPLGGYVRFRGDENAASAPDHEALEALRAEHEDPESVFHFKPIWQRAIVVAAGPAANFILAAVLFAVLGAVRGEVRLEPLVGSVMEDTAAEEAGFQPGDLIVSIDGKPVRGFSDISQTVFMRAGQPVVFIVERGGERVTLTATPRREMRDDGLGGQRAAGFLGIGASAQAERVYQRYALWEAPGYGVARTAETTGMIVDYLGRLVTGRASVEHINGPVGIATTAGQLANQAVSAPPASTVGAGEQFVNLLLVLIALSALLSVALGLMNLLPIPVLDGGHLVYYGYEAIMKRPPSQALQETGFRIGLGLILTMMVVATWNDLSYLRGLFF